MIPCNEILITRKFQIDVTDVVVAGVADNYVLRLFEKFFYSYFYVQNKLIFKITEINVMFS